MRAVDLKTGGLTLLGYSRGLTLENMDHYPSYMNQSIMSKRYCAMMRAGVQAMLPAGTSIKAHVVKKCPEVYVKALKEYIDTITDGPLFADAEDLRSTMIDRGFINSKYKGVPAPVSKPVFQPMPEQVVIQLPEVSSAEPSYTELNALLAKALDQNKEMRATITRNNAVIDSFVMK